jgi:thiol-disulfide isomerase/thioredoxin
LNNNAFRIIRLLAFLWGGIFFALLPGQVMGQTSETPKGKPALYEFGAGHCVSCKEMAKILGELQPQLSDQMEFRLVYMDKEEPLFKQYKIMLIPTQVFLDASGKEVDRHIGAFSKEDVIKKLQELKFIR